MGKRKVIKKSTKLKRHTAKALQNASSVTRAQFLLMKKADESAEMGFQNPLEDVETIKNTDLINPFLMHNLLFILTSRGESLADDIFTTNVYKIFTSFKYDENKILNLFDKNKDADVMGMVDKSVRKLMSTSSDRLFDTWLLICQLILKRAIHDRDVENAKFIMDMSKFAEKFDMGKADGVDEKDLSNIWGQTMKLIVQDIFSFSVFKFMVGMELERVIAEKRAEENPTFEKLSDLMIPAWQQPRQDYKLYPSILTVPLWTMESREQFAQLYTAYIKPFTSTDDEVFKTRGQVDTVSLSMDEATRKSWEPFVELLVKSYGLNHTTEELYTDTQDVFVEALGEAGHSIFMHLCGKFESYMYMVSEVMLLMIYTELLAKYIEKLSEDKKVLYESSQEEAKTLKATNRTLVKSVKDAEKQVEKLLKEIENLKEEGVKAQVDTDNAKILELQEKIKALDVELQVSKANEQKIKQSSDWKENKIKELMAELERYKEMETDLMQIQNENAAILSELERIEALEEESEILSNEDKLKQIENEPILFVGGTGGMFSKFRDMFPNSAYVDISEEGSNFDVASRFSYVAIYTKKVTHAHCSRIESQVDKSRIIYINICNTNLVIDELYKRIVK